MITIAFYRGRGGNFWQRLQDTLIRLFTRGEYSHCELAISMGNLSGEYECFTSSPRDGGVRFKHMPLPSNEWELIPLEAYNRYQVMNFYLAYEGKKYDWAGVLGFVLRTRQNPNRYFCSEFCAEFLGFPDPWRFSPNDLHAILKKKQSHDQS